MSERQRSDPFPRRPADRAALALLAALILTAGAGGEPPAVAQATVAQATVAPDSEGLLSVEGAELWVRRVGSGEPIVVVHGGPMLDHGYLAPALAPLAESYELVFFDQRLSGRSSPEADAVTLEAFVGDIEAVRTRLGLGRIHLLAHSFGGLFAMRYALEHGEHLRSLLLLDSIAASAELKRREEARVAGRMSDAIRARRQAVLDSEAFAERRPEAIERLLRITFSLQFHDPERAGALELYVPEDYMERSRRFGALAPELERFDLHDRLAEVEVPTLLLYGASEAGVELGGAALAGALPRAELVILDEAGHFPFLERREAFLAAVRGFLGRLRPRMPPDRQ